MNPTMQISAQNVSRLLQRHPSVDAWFPFRYSLEVESGCAYDCRFCRVNWFDDHSKNSKKIIQKVDLFKVLENDLRDLQKVRQKQLIGLGGGYNEIFSDKTNNVSITKKIIFRLMEAGHKSFLLTRTNRILDFKERFSEFPCERLPVVGCSFSCVDDAMAKTLEPDITPPSKRFDMVGELIHMGMKVGFCLMPMVPLYGDSDFEIKLFVSKARGLGVNFVLFSMADWTTLKHLAKTNFFSGEEIKQIEVYLLDEEKWKDYCWEKERYFIDECRENKIHPFIPHEIYRGYLSLRDEIITILLQLYYYSLYLGRRRDGFRFAAYSLNQLADEEFKIFLSGDESLIKTLPGVGDFILKIIQQMKMNGQVDFLKKLILDFFGDKK